MNTQSVLTRITRLFVLSAIVLSGLVLGRPGTALAEDAFVTATGRFAYIDDGGIVRPIKQARVEMCDEDNPGCALMGTTTTADDGTFRVSGTAGDWALDRPDPRVKVIADGPSGVVQNGTGMTYCFQSQPRMDLANGSTVDFGTLVPKMGVTCDTRGASTSGEDGAWQLYNNVREAWQFVRRFSLATPGRDVPQVKVHWPTGFGNSFYRGPLPGDNGAISINGPDAFNEAVIMHEYGHHVLQHFGEQPLPDYNNGVCDSVHFLIFGGHCLWQGEKGSIAWTEGWPDYLAEVLTTTLGKNDTASSSFGKSIESPPHPHPNESPSLPPADQAFDKVEGYVAAILWDLHDNANDVHGRKASQDRLAQGFATQWNVLVNFDPAPNDPNHNHITDIHEFWRGVAKGFPNLANRLSEIYDMNHITELAPDDNLEQAADLTVPLVGEPPPAPPATEPPSITVLRGGSFPASDTTANNGKVRTGVSSTTRYFLSSDAKFDEGIDVSVGSRLVPNLLENGQQNHGGITAVVPTAMPVGTYSLLACADAPKAVYEQDEAVPPDTMNNCGVWRTAVVVTDAPQALTGVSVDPTNVVGGTTTTGTVTLAGPAPAGGVVVSLSDDSEAASEPASVTVPAGTSSASFTISTSPVATDTTVTPSATANGLTKTATLTVRAARLSSLSLNPNRVAGGDDSTGTVTLDGPAPGGGVVVALSGDSAATSVPPSVTVPSGTTTVSFTVQTSFDVRQNTTATISGTAGVTKSAALTVLTNWCGNVLC